MKNNKKLNSILESVGNTPVVKLNRIGKEFKCDFYVKCEYFNPGGSVKDRIGIKMVEDAEKSRRIKPGDTLIEPTSGNTGIALAFTAAAKGYKLVLTMPESMSLERRRVMAVLGAELILTEAAKGMPGAIAKAKDPIMMAKSMRDAVISGRRSYLAGRMKFQKYGSASTEDEGLI